MGVVAVLLAVLAGCQNQPPSYQRPTVSSYEATTQPAQPGDTVTIVVQAHDDEGVTGGAPRWLFTPSGSQLLAQRYCDVTMEPVTGFLHVALVFTCELPEVASNGTWQLEARINDGTPPIQNYPGLDTRFEFEVTGGSEDRSAPVLVSHSFSPTVIDQETTFTLSLRLRDESLPIALGQGGSITNSFVKPFAQNSMFTCRELSTTPVSSTEVDVVLQCSPSNYNTPGRSEPGRHQSGLIVTDALEQEGMIMFSIEVQPVAG